MKRTFLPLLAVLPLAPLVAGATGAGEPPAEQPLQEEEEFVQPEPIDPLAMEPFGQFIVKLIQVSPQEAAEMVGQMKDVNEATQAESITAMHAAVAHNRLDILEELLKHGANTEKLMKPGLTPLGAAAMKNDTDSIAMLLKHGAKLNFQTRGGVTALKLACAKGNVDAAQVLLAHGADAGSTDSEGHTALSLAQEHAGENRLPLMRMLLEHGASPEAQVGETGWRPLARAVAMHDTAVAELLLKAGADPKLADASGKSALDYAAGDAAMGEMLRRYTAP